MVSWDVSRDNAEIRRGQGLDRNRPRSMAAVRQKPTLLETA
jgi:hypothetical protein